jgi:hypothetical protein
VRDLLGYSSVEWSSLSTGERDFIIAETSSTLEQGREAWVRGHRDKLQREFEIARSLL